MQIFVNSIRYIKTEGVSGPFGGNLSWVG